MIDVATVNRTQLARETGYDLAHISRIFSGKGKPSIKAARKIAAALGVSMDDLMKALDEVECKE